MATNPAAQTAAAKCNTEPVVTSTARQHGARVGACKSFFSSTILTHDMNSVFRLAVRRRKLSVGGMALESAPVSEKRVGLNRSPRCQAYGR